jgi:hypothetical protein
MEGFLDGGCIEAYLLWRQHSLLLLNIQELGHFISMLLVLLFEGS